MPNRTSPPEPPPSPPPASSPIDTSPPRPRFPKWTLLEQDLWIDMFDSYSGTLLGAAAHEDSSGRVSDAVAECVVRQAAILADVAIQEVGYRFWVQKLPKRPRKPKPARRRSAR